MRHGAQGVSLNACDLSTSARWCSSTRVLHSVPQAPEHLSIHWISLLRLPLYALKSSWRNYFDRGFIFPSYIIVANSYELHPYSVPQAPQLRRGCPSPLVTHLRQHSSPDGDARIRSTISPPGSTASLCAHTSAHSSNARTAIRYGRENLSSQR